MQRQTTNARIISNANISENKNGNQEASISTNLRKKYDVELNSSNHSEQDRKKQTPGNSNVTFLGKINLKLKNFLRHFILLSRKCL